MLLLGCYSWLFCLSKALMVLLSNIAMVIGPTPPGTGVMAAATYATVTSGTLHIYIRVRSATVIRLP
jgi:hypothetical protein